ncbi:MAG: hypothetical protein JSV86_21240 [Gemmatimonadota bacterium]|nr:MAG: hypothetical protein JSV86_21240 [Gemmatimonadota bacterium]
MKHLLHSFRIVPPLFRFLAADIVRNRRGFLLAVLAGYAVVEVLIAASDAASSPEGFGGRFILALLIASAPFCRSGLDEDVRLGFAAFWLQKPVRVIDLYLARTVAAVAWSVLVVLAVGLASIPAALGAVSVADVARAVVALGWIPTLLTVLSFLGAALGVRNGGLFAYGMLFAGFALPGLKDALGLGPGLGLLETLLPPTFSAPAANTALRGGDLLRALAELRPLLVYTAVCAALALSLCTRVPKRLGGDCAS